MKRWGEDLNEFIKSKVTEECRGCHLRNNDTWIRIATKKKPTKRTKEAEEEQTNCKRSKSHEYYRVFRWIGCCFVVQLKFFWSRRAIVNNIAQLFENIKNRLSCLVFSCGRLSHTHVVMQTSCSPRDLPLTFRNVENSPASSTTDMSQKRTLNPQI